MSHYSPSRSYSRVIPYGSNSKQSRKDKEERDWLNLLATDNNDDR